MSSTLALQPLLEASSIAVIGASADPHKIGGRPIEYLKRYGFAGRIIPVNPKRDTVQGLPCVPRITAAEAVDLAIIAAPGEEAPSAVEQCIAARVRGIVLFSAGFAEVDAAGRAQQARMAAAASEAGVVLLGPNCLGAINAHRRVVATFTTALESMPLPQGEFSYVGQSGALGAYWIDKVVSAGIGISKWITTGNEAQVSLAQALAYLADDAETRLIGMYIEDIKEPAIFASAANAARAAGKEVLAIKAGRSSAGARAVSAHTGADAGDDGSYSALLSACGVTRVDSLTEMVDVARLKLASRPVAHARRLGVVTVSGGAGVLICDAAADAGLQVAELSSAIVRELDQVLPKFVRRQNPIDVTGAVVTNTALLLQTIETLARAETVDIIVLFFGLMNSIKQDIVNAARGAGALGKPVIVIWMGASEESRLAIEQVGIPVFNEIPSAIGAIAKSA